jgi:protein CpxP
MYRYRWITAAVAMAAVLMTGAALAQGPRGGGPFGVRGPFGDGRFELGALNLTDAQRDQVREIRDRHREQARAANQRLSEVLDKQREAIRTVPVDEALITSLTQDLTQAQVEVALQQARLNAEIFAVLTPEQQNQLKELRARRQTQIDERKQRGQQRRNR